MSLIGILEKLVERLLELASSFTIYPNELNRYGWVFGESNLDKLLEMLLRTYFSDPHLMEITNKANKFW